MVLVEAIDDSNDKGDYDVTDGTLALISPTPPLGCLAGG